ncbi:response regulator, partial [Methylocucumis oryzae]
MTQPSSILVVDDDPVNLSIISHHLTNYDFNVYIAQEGLEALTRAELLLPDLILLDIMLPDLTGFEVCQRLKSNVQTRDIPVIFMTASNAFEDRITGFTLGAIDYLIKPIHSEELKVRISTHINLATMRRELIEHKLELEQKVALRTAELSNSYELLKTEINERQIAEEKLAMSVQEFKTLAESLPDPIARYDRQRKKTYTNRPNLHIQGIDEPDKAHCYRLITPSVEEFAARLQWVIDNGISDEILTELLDPQANTVNHNVYFIPEFDDNGLVKSVLSISHDITGIKRMEAMLLKSELEFRTLAENSPEIILRYDLNCRHVYLNPAFERETSIPLDYLWNSPPNQHWDRLMPSQDYIAKLKRIMTTGQSDKIILEWRGQDNTQKTHKLHAVAERNEDNQIIGVLVIGHNITELKATERRLEESRTQLRALTAKREEAREEERKRIAREIHDELGQLLNVLRLNLTTLDFRFGDANQDLRNTAQKMLTTLDRAILMVRSLATRLRPAVLNTGIVSALDWLVQEFTDSTGISCQLHTKLSELKLNEDKAMLIFRIVQESLTNVLKHAYAQRVDVYLSLNNSTIVVSISDNGIGIKAEQLEKHNAFGILG